MTYVRLNELLKSSSKKQLLQLSDYLDLDCLGCGKLDLRSKLISYISNVSCNEVTFTNYANALKGISND